MTKLLRVASTVSINFVNSHSHPHLSIDIEVVFIKYVGDGSVIVLVIIVSGLIYTELTIIIIDSKD